MKKADSSVSSSRACCACRTCTTCTRACRSSSRTSRSADRASCSAPVPMDRAPDDPPVPRGRRHLSVARRDGAIDQPEARAVLIENAPGAGDKAATPADAAAIRRGARRRRRDAAGRLHRNVRGLSGTRPPVRRDGHRAAQPSRREAPARGRRIRAGGPGQAAGERGRHRRRSRSSPAIGPPPRFPRILLAADVLVSSRSRGTNTPLKIYQYLRAGRPIVATRLLTHTQVLSDETAILTGATAGRVRGGNPGRAQRSRPRGERRRTSARTLAETKYSDEAYIERTRRAPANSWGW